MNLSMLKLLKHILLLQAIFHILYLWFFLLPLICYILPREKIGISIHRRILDNQLQKNPNYFRIIHMKL